MGSGDYDDLLAEYAGMEVSKKAAGKRRTKSFFKKKQGGAEFLEPITPKGEKFDPLVFDIESKAGPGAAPGFVRPFLVGLWDGESFLAFRNDSSVLDVPWRRRHFAPGGCIDRFMVVLMTLYPGRKIYAHNGGGFDMLFLFAWLRRHPEYAFEIVPVQSSILRIDVWPRNSKTPKKDGVIFLDSMRLLPGSLDKSCKAFGVKGKTTETEAELLALLSLPEDDPRWESYLRGDCICLREVLLKFHELITRLGGDVATTTPATAMRLFRMKYLPEAMVSRIERHQHWKNCKQKSCLGCLHDWMRQGYKGGRVEIYTMKGEGLHYYDFNSSYPAVLKQPMPVGAKVEEFGRCDWTMLDRGFVGFVECDVYIPTSCNIPPLPFQKDGKLIFPTGRFSGVWDAHELKLLDHELVRGSVLQIRRAVWYHAEPIFQKMIDELYKLRQRCPPGSECDKKKLPQCLVCGFDIGISELAKLLMNAFYGKFGMDPNREKILILDELEDGKRKSPPQGAKPAWHAGDPDSALTSDVWYAPQVTDADYIVPQVAAHVTALARRALWLEMIRVSTTKVVQSACRVMSVGLTADGAEKLEVVKTMLVKLEDVHPSSALKHPGDEGMLVTQHVWTKKDKAWGEGVTQDIVVARERGYGVCLDRRADGLLVAIDFQVRRSLVHPESRLREPGDVGELVTWGQLFYVDTDSMLTDATIVSSTTLGEMKDEYPGDLVDFVAVQPKGYKTKKHSTGHVEVKFKGLPKQERTERSFQKMLDHEVVSYRRLGKVRTLAAQDFWTSPSMVEVEKSVKSQYDKRVLLEDGTTLPLVLDGDRVVSPERFRGFVPLGQ